MRGFVVRTERALHEAGIAAYELVLVGNYHEGADDPTPRIVQELAAQNPRIVTTTLPKEGMMGWDMKTGLTLARGRYVAVIDGDGQMPLNDVVRVYDAIRREGFDMAKTYRLTRGDSRWRKALSWGYNFLFHIMFPGMTVRDVNAKPKIFTHAALNKLDLRSDDWFIDAEIMIKARRLKYKIGEVPTVFLGLIGRRSFVRPSTAFEFLKNLARYRWKEFWT